ncbi:MAG: GEVED domain-containing protein [Bacteroidales bacterium]|nr:GEVED domain-containing protein [Bacteroidales bacterium]
MPISNDVSIPYAQSTLLTATATNNNTIIWYSDPYTTQELSRNTYQTPILYTTDTFYVGSMLQHPLTATIGTGTTTNAQTGYPSPLNCYQKQVKEQYLVRTSDLINGGMTGNGNMSSIAFNISNITFFTGKTTDTILNYTIKVGTTTDSVLSTWESGLTEVYNIDTLHLTSSDINTWKIFNFTEPYYWDGVSNLVVEVCFSSPSNYSRVQTKYTPKTYTAALSYRSASVNACQWTGNPSSSSQQLPNMQIGFNEFGCNSVRKPVIVTVAPPPTCDAGLLSFTEPVGQTIMSGLPTPVKVILKNFGSDTLKVATINWTINGVNQTPYTWTGNLPINTFDTVQIGSPIFHSGLILLIASVNSNCTDTLHSNDTAQLNLSACMGNNIATTTLTIGAGASYDYHSFAEAINAVVVSGLCGPIVFNVAPGTYNEKIVIPQILGSSSTNTITFKGQTTEKPILKYVTTTNDNITVRLDSTANINFENIEILNSKETNPTLVNITKSNNINFTNVLFSSPVSTVTNLVNLQDVNNLVNFVKDTFDCGLNSIVSFDDSISNNLMIDSCLFTSFQSNALDINSCENVIVKNNKITTNTSIKGENIRFNKIAGTSKIVANDIYNVGGTLLRKGIEVKRSNFTMNTPLAIYNNSVSLVGPANNSTITYVGLDIDSSTYINIYYNTLRVFSVRSAMNTKTIAIGKTLLNNINIRNNNIDNSAGGYAYYVQANNTMVTSSDNNNYYSNGTRFAYWGTTNALNIATLRTTNGYDMYSVSVENPFTSDSVLSLLYPTPIVRAAEPLADVLVDIRGLYRPISPKPTIGAYEYVFANKDAGITEIKSPINTIKYIENDSLVVKVKVKNFGNYTIDTIKFVAELKYHRDDATNIQTATEQYVGTLASLDTMVYTFNTIFYPPLNTPITDSLYLRVYTQLKGDSLNNNDSSTVQFLVIPAKNLQDIKTNNILERCKLYNVQVSAVLKNVGEKPIVNSDSIYVTYEVQGRPDLKVKERLILPYTDATGTYSSIQKNSQITYTFNQTANLYPLGLNDTTWKMRTYITMGKDHVPANDTSNYITINSRRSPNQPIAYNDTIPYATWGHPSAAQEDGLIIRWFKDSTDVAPFYSPSTYVNSQNYTTTQMFTDSTYYLRVNLTGSYPCPSYYTPIHVVLKNRAPVDASAISVVEPPAPGWVYMTDQDTIKAVITNYGTTPLTSFNVSYSIRATNPPNQTPTVVTEVCHATIQPDGLYTYKFNTLANFSDPTKIYEVRVWTGATNDITALNDTTPYLYVHPKNGNTIYPNATVSNGNSIDITKVRMATIENESTPSASTYSNYTETVPPIVVFKGTDDTLFVKIDRASTMKSDANVAGWMGVYIDYDRDGMFIGQAVGTATQITSYLGDVVYLDTITNEKVGKEIGIKIHIPDTAMNGYRRMRIVVNQDANFNNVYSFNLQKGEIEDYKIQIRNMEDVNAELMRFVTPVKDTLTRQALKVELKNTGRQTLTNATITWKLNDGLSNTFNWSGNLTTSQTTIIFLDSITLNQGNNSLLAYVDVAGDAYHGNDTLKRSVNIIHAYKLTYENKFDLQAGASDFYADEINPYTPSNCWEYGTPAQTNTTIKSAYSAPNCWKTKLNGTYTRNTESILYSPVFNTGVIKPDTLSFMMKKAMNSGASMTIEYTDWSSRNISEPHWVKLGAKNDGYGTNWYNDTTGFTGTANAWQKVSYSLEHLNHLGMIGNHMQLRFIFKSNSGTPGDGIAIDDFKLYRGRRHQDIGVVAVEVTPLSMPNYGSYFYPKVKIVNFGTDTLTSFKVCYFSEDMYIPQCETLMGQNFKPDDTISYTFNQGHYLNVSMPDPFALCAFTRLGQEDIYSDNDSTCTSIVIGPLEKDAAILEIASPTNLVSSNDDVDIDIKIKNYGLQPITTLPVGFYIPGNAIVHDTITFNPPLNSGQEYTYRFPQKYHASFGIVNLKCWVGLDGDYYHDNDTIYKRIEGTNTTHDLEAKSVILDETSDPNNVIVGLKFYNKSSIGVGNIKVGYYVNGNSNNTIEETYRAGGIVPSSTYACHTFSTKLPKSGGPYQSVCAYVTIADENDRSNDTTCEMYTAQRDGVADTIFIEETVEPTVLVQLIGHNGGTIGGASTPVRAHIVLNNDFSHVYTQTFNWVFDEPNPLYKAYMTFTERLPKSANGQYNIVGWIEYPNDINHRNDTTRAYKVKGYVGLDDSIANNGEFVLEQNKPNPFNTTTTIGFNLPHQGKINFYIVNSVGQVVYRKDGDYPEGHNTISFNRETLPQGIYYYIMQFDKEKLTKKMVIIR